MVIASARPSVHAAFSRPASSRPGNHGSEETPPPEDKENFWREIFSGELFELGLKLTPDKINDTVEAARGLGEGLRDQWKDLRDKVSDVLKLPQVESVVSPEARQKTTEIVLTTAKGLGYGAAGIQAVGGFYKLATGFKLGDTARKLDGVFDLTTAAAIASAIAGAGPAPLILGPAAAALGVVRGGYNAVTGFRSNDTRHEIQGILDAGRSLSVGFRLLGEHSGGLALAGAILGPLAGAVQVGRGYFDLSSGLEEQNKQKQVQGLTDIASAVGLTMSVTGLGTIPGIALAGLAVGTRVLYQFNDGFKGWTDRRLEQMRPGLETTVEQVDKVVDPVVATVRPWVEKLTGWRRGDQDPKNEK